MDIATGLEGWELIKDAMTAVVGWMSQISWLGKTVLEWGFYVFLVSFVWGFVLQPLLGGRDILAGASDAVERRRPRTTETHTVSEGTRTVRSGSRSRTSSYRNEGRTRTTSRRVK